jgi:uncharacterized membrane protein
VILGIAMVLTASIMWGLSNILLKRSIAQGMSPESANAVQTGFSAIFMVIIWIVYVFLNGPYIPDVLSLTYLILGTLIGLALGTTIYLYGLKLVDASLASPLSSTSPFFVMLMAIPFLGEKINLFLILGALLTFTGIVVLGRKEGHTKISRKGILLVSIAPVFWAMTIVFYRIALKSMDIYTANAIRMSILGATMCLYVKYRGLKCFPERRPMEDSALAGIFNYVLGGTAFLFGLTMIGASRASALSSGTPFFTMLFAALFLKERIKRTYVYGGALVVIGLILLSFS